MELLLPKRFLVLLVALVVLAGAVYLVDGGHRAAVMGTVWGLADRVAALIVPGDVAEVAMAGAGGQAGGLVRPVATATFTPPVMPAAVFEQERKRTPTPAPTATPTATPTPAPTPTPPPTRDPEVVYPGRVSVQVKGRDIIAVVHPPRVRYVEYTYSTVIRRWEPVSVTVPATIDVESIEFLLTVVVPEEGYETPPDFLDLDLRTLDYEVQRRPDGSLVVRARGVPVSEGYTYRVRMRARVGNGDVLTGETTFTP